MKQQEFDERQTRIAARAEKLWVEAGRPGGSRAMFEEEARELVAIEEVPIPMIGPDADPIIEEASIQRNLGEFPTLTDQGEEQTFPDEIDDGDDDTIRLSDGDASDTGGVLPEEDVLEEELPEVSVADADDLTSGPLDEDDDLRDDINEDGLPDQPSLDEEVDGEMDDGDEYEDTAPPDALGR